MKTLISLDDVESIKRELIQILPNVKSSHRVEAMARGLGRGSRRLACRVGGRSADAVAR